MSKQTNFLGVKARKMKPTARHEPALWENMLGTVYARNAAGVTKYFDYDYEAARAWVGMDDDSDPRVAPFDHAYSGEAAVNQPRKGQLVLYVKRLNSECLSCGGTAGHAPTEGCLEAYFPRP